MPAGRWVMSFGGRGKGLPRAFPPLVRAQTSEEPARRGSGLAELPQCVLQPVRAGEAVKNVLNCNQMFAFKRI